MEALKFKAFNFLDHLFERADLLFGLPDSFIFLFDLACKIAILVRQSPVLSILLSEPLIE